MRAILLALAVAAAVALAVVRSAPAQLDGHPMPSPVIFPVQTIPLSFSHQRHLALKLNCAYCHENAPDSTRAADDLIPAEATCATCHAIERDKPDKQVAKGEPPARCAACHPSGPQARVVVPAPNLKFNHKVHADRKIRCQTCHGDLATDKIDLATRAQLPGMQLCLGCHDGKTAPSACTTCHLGTKDAMVRTNFVEGKLLPSGVLRGDAHDLRFTMDHARVAANDQKYCMNCHARPFCVECHDGVAKPMDFHGNDYISLHAVDARRNTPDCSGCHRRQTFCTACHARSGVSDDQRTSEFQRPSLASGAMPAVNRFHPDGWWTSKAGMRQSTDHSFQAQRNIRACASCHREQFCVECHAQTVNPHPADWAHSSRCKALVARSARMCFRCHQKVEDVKCD